MKKNLDMTEGKPISLLWAFTFPTLMGNLLNQVYSITDSIVVGRYLGQTALAAVGSTMPVILLLAALMIGINVGVGIIISRYFGQKNEELMRRAFVNSLYLGLFLSAGMMVMGLTFSGTILRWMGTPEGPLQEATAYLEISFITMICPLMYYLFSSAFRGLGDSQTALYCLIVSVLSNIGLDVLFVAVFRWGVAGSAWATALAQALSAVVAAEIGDDTILQGADCHDAAGGTADDSLCLSTHAAHLIGLGIHSHDRGFPHDDALALHVNQGIGSTQINANVL